MKIGDIVRLSKYDGLWKIVGEGAAKNYGLKGPFFVIRELDPPPDSEPWVIEMHGTVLTLVSPLELLAMEAAEGITKQDGGA